jgi:hypothetical protein
LLFLSCPKGVYASQDGKSRNTELHCVNLKVNDHCRDPAQLPAAAQVNMAQEDEQYHPKDAVKAGINGALITAAAGGLVSAIQNTLTRKNVSAWGVFTRTGGTIVVFCMFYPTDGAA